MDETEAGVGIITESGLCTTMVGIVPGLAVLVVERIEPCSGEWAHMAWYWEKEGTGEVEGDNLIDRCSPTVNASAGER